MSAIARDVARPPACIFSYLRYHGGIQPRTRSKRANALLLQEREEISRGLASGESIRSIARALNRSPSTICREITRNGGAEKYRALDAEKAAAKRARRRKPHRPVVNNQLRQLVVEKLLTDWSPEQISGWLKIRYPNEPALHVSHETIYKGLFVQARGILKQELLKHLRTKRHFRHARSHSPGTRGAIVDGVSIRERPATVDDRTMPGHWEGDLICVGNNSYVATVVERKTRFTVLVKVPNKSTTDVVDALARRMAQLPSQLRQSLTWDRGSELGAHKAFSEGTQMTVYFCDPSSPWQRGTNENTNGLLRQYFPKKMNLGQIEQSRLDQVTDLLNARPRKTLSYRTPTEEMLALLQ